MKFKAFRELPSVQNLLTRYSAYPVEARSMAAAAVGGQATTHIVNRIVTVKRRKQLASMEKLNMAIPKFPSMSPKALAGIGAATTVAGTAGGAVVGKSQDKKTPYSEQNMRSAYTKGQQDIVARLRKKMSSAGAEKTAENLNARTPKENLHRAKIRFGSNKEHIRTAVRTSRKVVKAKRRETHTKNRRYLEAAKDRRSFDEGAKGAVKATAASGVGGAAAGGLIGNALGGGRGAAAGAALGAVSGSASKLTRRLLQSKRHGKRLEAAKEKQKQLYGNRLAAAKEKTSSAHPSLSTPYDILWGN